MLASPFPATTKKAVDIGNVPSNAVAYCDLARVALFMSNSFRDERQLWFYHAEDKTALKLEGGRLRYLGPDARSQLMLLLKAWAWATKRMGRETGPAWNETTPGFSVGINVTREAVIDAFIDSNRERVPFIIEWSEADSLSPITTCDTTYIDSVTRPGASSIIVDRVGEISEIIKSAAHRGQVIKKARLSARLPGPRLPALVMAVNLLEDVSSP